MFNFQGVFLDPKGGEPSTQKGMAGREPLVFFPQIFGKTWNQSLSLCPMIFFCWIFFSSFGTSKKSPWGFTNCLPKNDRRGAIFLPSFFHFQDFGVTVAGHCAQCGLGCATCRTAGSCMECAMARFFFGIF